MVKYTDLHDRSELKIAADFLRDHSENGEFDAAADYLSSTMGFAFKVIPVISNWWQRKSKQEGLILDEAGYVPQLKGQWLYGCHAAQDMSHASIAICFWRSSLPLNNDSIHQGSCWHLSWRTVLSYGMKVVPALCESTFDRCEWPNHNLFDRLPEVFMELSHERILMLLEDD